MSSELDKTVPLFANVGGAQKRVLEYHFDTAVTAFVSTG
jgi:hypothetical protein